MCHPPVSIWFKSCHNFSVCPRQEQQSRVERRGGFLQSVGSVQMHTETFAETQLAVKRRSRPLGDTGLSMVCWASGEASWCQEVCVPQKEPAEVCREGLRGVSPRTQAGKACLSAGYREGGARGGPCPVTMA